MDRMQSILYPHRKDVLPSELVAQYVLPSSGKMSTSS